MGVPPSPRSSADPAPSRPHIAVAILGSGEAAATLARELVRLDNVEVASIWCPRPDGPAGIAAAEIGADIRTDLGTAARAPGVDLVIDASGDERAQAVVSALLPRNVELLSGSSVRLLARVLADGGSGERRVLAELRAALDRVRGQERRLLASRESLVRANAALDHELAEIYFMHEFFKDLTAYTDPLDVCSLIVDAANGMFGATISAVYLVEREDWTFRLCASQGRPVEAFRDAVPVAETTLGEAFRRGLSNSAVRPPSPVETGWIASGAVSAQAAVALQVGSEVIAVLAMGFPDDRVFDSAELDRLRGMADQAALAVQNAILHGELERLSVTDRLTGLFNRGYFEQRLDGEVSRAQRYGHRLSLILLDIDEFKSFNDSYGHPAGDDVLRMVSAVIGSNLREMDIAARYGGEEFVIVLPETDTAGALRVAERVREQIELLSFEVGQEGPVSRSVSVGVATLPEMAPGAPELVKAADEAMYRAKRQGKNRVVSAADADGPRGGE
ncbi:MAG: GGDEF domain-containing protein [Coriobacteriales bacterium]|nr:GGDEF domain-containing protein [Coriobacteriales bacterium]